MGFTALHCRFRMETTPVYQLLSRQTCPQSHHPGLVTQIQAVTIRKFNPSAQVTSLSSDPSILIATLTPAATPLVMLCITMGFYSLLQQ